MADLQRLLLVHAHPDDETIDNGATIARYMAGGAHVTLVTCTLGEEGDIVVPELAHLGAGHEDRLAEHREGELRNAMSALGVTDHRILHAADRYRDSGMRGSAGNDHPRSFWNADVDDAARHLVEIIREVRPQVLVTYNPDGGYGHPDHIQAHRVAMRAAELAGDPGYPSSGRTPHTIAKIYWNCFPRRAAQSSIEALRAEESTSFGSVDSADELNVMDDDFATCAIDASKYADAKADAMRAHATQLTVHGAFYALSNNIGRLISGTEYYHLAHSRVSVGEGSAEDDLFAGI